MSNAHTIAKQQQVEGDVLMQIRNLLGGRIEDAVTGMQHPTKLSFRVMIDVSRWRTNKCYYNGISEASLPQRA